MDYRIEEKEPFVYRLEFDIPPDEIAAKVEEELRELRKRVTIPGFRKGKAPLEMVKIRYGKDVEKDVVENLAKEKARAILAGEDYKIWGPLYLVSKEITPEGAHVVLEFDVEPQAEIKKLEGLKVVKEIRRVTDEDVERVLESLRKDQAMIKKVEDGAKEGHYVLADFQEVDVAGTPIIGRKFKDRYFRLGEGDLGEQLQEQLLGVTAGDERKVKISYPDQQGKTKEEYYSVQVREVQEHILPELDDEFARAIGEEFKTLEDLKKRIREDLQARYDHEAEERLREAIIEEAIKNNPVEIPPRIVETYIANAYEDYSKDRQPKPDFAEFAQQFRPVALRHLQWFFLMEKIIKEKGLEVTDEEVEKEIERQAAETKGVSPERVREYYRRPQELKRLKERLQEEKVIEYLLKNAKITEVDVTQKDKELIQPA